MWTRHCSSGSVIRDGGKFRMWYMGWSAKPHPMVLYAESDDGKAVLGQIYNPHPQRGIFKSSSTSRPPASAIR